jgi:hypothetical protein
VILGVIFVMLMLMESRNHDPSLVLSPKVLIDLLKSSDSSKLTAETRSPGIALFLQTYPLPVIDSNHFISVNPGFVGRSGSFANMACSSCQIRGLCNTRHYLSSKQGFRRFANSCFVMHLIVTITNDWI